MNRKSRQRGKVSNYKGLSHEQCCIFSASDCSGKEVFKCVNTEKPSSKNANNVLLEKVEPNSMIITDGAFCYNQLIEKTNSELIQCKTTNCYTKVKHLIMISSCHIEIKRIITNLVG